MDNKVLKIGEPLSLSIPDVGVERAGRTYFANFPITISGVGKGRFKAYIDHYFSPQPIEIIQGIPYTGTWDLTIQANGVVQLSVNSPLLFEFEYSVTNKELNGTKVIYQHQPVIYFPILNAEYIGRIHIDSSKSTPSVYYRHWALSEWPSGKLLLGCDENCMGDVKEVTITLERIVRE